MFIKCLLLLLAASFLSAGHVPASENRIIGGMNIQIEDAPWQVSLQVSGQHSCGGSIYSNEIIITAAHCFYDANNNTLEAKDFLVLVGSEYWRYGGTLVQVVAIKHHEYFSMKSKRIRYDIGIMKLFESLTFTTKVQRIPLATMNPAPQSTAWSTGWGKAMFYDAYLGPYLATPETLQGINIDINDLNLCKMYFPMAEGTICAGAGGGTPCQGDSGGPLVVNNELVGVVSAGSCESFGIYTSVAYFHTWILSSIEAI